MCIRDRLEDRERLLSRLDAQPQWVVYGAALLGSIASTLVMHPVDTIKTRLQSGQDTEVELPSGAADLKELYVGIGPNLVKEAPPSAVYLGVYEAVKTRLLASGKVPALAAPDARYAASSSDRSCARHRRRRRRACRAARRRARRRRRRRCSSTPRGARTRRARGRRRCCATCRCCLLYTSPSPRDRTRSRMPSSA